jgi:hypothetical protein
MSYNMDDDRTYFSKFNYRTALDNAWRSIDWVLQESGVGENPPLTQYQYESLKEIRTQIGKVKSTIRE